MVTKHKLNTAQKVIKTNPMYDYNRSCQFINKDKKLGNKNEGGMLSWCD